MDQILKKSLEKIGIEITDEQKEQFDIYTSSGSGGASCGSV